MKSGLLKGAAAAADQAKKVADAAADSGKKAVDAASQAADAAPMKIQEMVCELLERNLGEGAADALKAVAETMDGLYKDLFPDAAAKYPCLLNLGMILGQVMQENRYKSPMVSGAPWKDTEVLKKAARYAKFANAVYRSSEEEIMERIPELKLENIHHLHKTKAVACPNFLIATDPVTDTLVLAIRGTASAADALTDCLCQETDFLGAKAHGAISQSTAGLVKTARPILAELLEKSNKKVVVTGHSLGAGTSVLVTLSLFSEASSDSLHKPDLVECFAFAPPPVFYPRTKLPEEPQIYSFINNMDVIPRLCLGTGTKLCLAIKEVDSMDMNLAGRLKFMTAFPSEPKLPDFMEIRDDLMEKYHLHDPAGKLILLYPDGGEGGKYVCDELTPDLTDRILLHKRMASDHSMNEYLKILEEMASERLPLQLQKLPASKLKEIDDALALLQEHGLTEIDSIESVRKSIASKLV